jgi:hypothetical protein
MTDYTSRSRRLARESYWQAHARDSYECPDCGRSESELQGTFEVHHKNGEPLDNRLENRGALCRICHMLREDKSPHERLSNTFATNTPTLTVNLSPSLFRRTAKRYHQ